MTPPPRPRRLLWPALLLLLGASDPWVDASTQDLHGYARAASLDLRGVVPTSHELAAIAEADRQALPSPRSRTRSRRAARR